jgi:hypothetical protein
MVSPGFLLFKDIASVIPLDSLGIETRDNPGLAFALLQGTVDDSIAVESLDGADFIISFDTALIMGQVLDNGFDDIGSCHTSIGRTDTVSHGFS